jgi:TolB-like protein
MPGQSKAVFLSYASEDEEAAGRIAEGLRAAGIEVWFDRSELRGGDAWDRHIHQQIHDCRLFIAVISAHSDARDEGYFRREWRLAVDRTLDMDENKAFLVPVGIDHTSERSAAVPEAFRQVQWTHLPHGNTAPAFVARVLKLLGADAAAPGGVGESGPGPLHRSSSAVTPHSYSRWVLGTAVGLLIAAAGAWMALRGYWAPGTRVDSPASEATIAVLPFADLSEQRDQQYFGDGLAEEILNVLGTIPGLRTIGRSSSFQFRDQSKDLRKVGAALGATYIVDGSVRKSGNQLRVTAQLVNATDGTTRWSDTYAPSPADALTLQRKIATAVAHALRMTVMDYFSGGGTRSEQAHDLYLRGIRDTDSGISDAMRRAVTELERAVEIDPNYVDGWLGLANAYDNVASSGLAPATEAYRLARQAVDRTLALDPKNSDAYSVRAFLRMNSYDWTGAEEDIRRSSELHPSANANEAAAKLAVARGKLGDAARLLESVLATDPLDAYALDMLGYPVYPAQGRYKEADQALDKLRDINPNSDWLNGAQALVAFWMADRDRALRLADVEPDQLMKQSALLLIYASEGHKALAQRAFEQIRAIPNVNAYDLATAYAMHGERDPAFEQLDKAYDQRSPMLLFLQSDLLLANLRKDERYTALLRKMKLLQ